MIIVFSLISFTLYAVAEINNNKYWKDWEARVKDFHSCKSGDAVKKFLLIATDNLEYSERTNSNAEAIEVLILNNPECFCDAYKGLDKYTQQNVTEFFLKKPIFYDIKKIKHALMSTKHKNSCVTF